MALHMSEQKRNYIPLGCDQQGRRATGVWTHEDIGRSAWSAPHRTHDTGPDTIPTDRAPLEAHGCWEPPDDRACEDGGGVIVWLAGGVAALLTLGGLAVAGGFL